MRNILIVGGSSPSALALSVMAALSVPGVEFVAVNREAPEVPDLPVLPPLPPFVIKPFDTGANASGWPDYVKSEPKKNRPFWRDLPRYRKRRQSCKSC